MVAFVVVMMRVILLTLVSDEASGDICCYRDGDCVGIGNGFENTFKGSLAVKMSPYVMFTVISEELVGQ